MMQYTGIFFIILFFLLSPFVQVSTAENQAQFLYNEYQDRVYQIRIIEIASGEKSSIGSGFQISPEGHIATNYHVISELIHDPELYRLEYVRPSGESGSLTVLDIDVIHDLAVVTGEDLHEAFIPLGDASLEKGTQVYSLGNPRDLGMTIIEGTYNGLLENTLYEQIFFSGALNRGMSGGPAVDSEGKVIGINVSGGGNQLSFLVPVHYLETLIRNVKKNNSQPAADFSQRIEEQLIENQEHLSAELLEKEWKTVPLGDVLVPSEIAKYFKCWGNSDKDPDILYSHTYSYCSSRDDIYLSSAFRTGFMEFWFDWYATEQLDAFRFYNVYGDSFHNVEGAKADKENASNFVCKTAFVEVNDMDWKVALCLRKYKKYLRLYEFILSAALTSETNKGIVANFSISGVEKETGLKFSQKFLESIQWKK